MKHFLVSVNGAFRIHVKSKTDNGVQQKGKRLQAWIYIMLRHLVLLTEYSSVIPPCLSNKKVCGIMPAVCKSIG